MKRSVKSWLSMRVAPSAAACVVGALLLLAVVMVSAVSLGRSARERRLTQAQVEQPTTAPAPSRVPRAKRAATAPASTQGIPTDATTKPAAAESATTPDESSVDPEPATPSAEELAAAADDRKSLLAPPIFGYSPPTTKPGPNSTLPANPAELPGKGLGLGPAPEPPPPTAPAPPATERAPATAPTTLPGPPPGPVPARRAVVRRPKPTVTPIPVPGNVTDERIAEAIQRSIEYLAHRFDAKTKTVAPDMGHNTLAVYALLQGGLAVDDTRLNPRGPLGSAMLDRVVRMESAPGLETYSYGVRSTCLALFNRPQDRQVLNADVRLLVNGHHQHGAYGYTVTTAPGNGYSDNSNSQYGALGVWSGADVGIEVPLSYWGDVQNYWESGQHKDGGWAYQRNSGGSYDCMTYAGLASLLVAQDFLRSRDRDDSVGKPPYTPAIERGFGFLNSTNSDKRLNVVPDPLTDRGAYENYGQERVGLASGFKHIGGVDWYRSTTKTILDAQDEDGSWTDSIVTNSFNLLFLSRARHPILMNKLGFDGFWANRPLDLSHLTPWVSRQTERPLNWQIVSVNAPWTEWTDAPILYIASHQAPNFNKVQVEKLRNYALAGGLIFCHTDGGRASFDDYVTKLAAQLFPEYEFTDVRSDHPLYSCVFKLNANRVPLRGISNGSRLLMVHTKLEMAARWQWRDWEATPDPFRFAVNLHVYAAGKRDLRRRLQSFYVPEYKPHVPLKKPKGPETKPTQPTINVARVQYNGPWDPEPSAWTRFTRLMGYHTGTIVNVKTVKLSDLSADQTPFAHMTGMAKYLPTEQEKDAIKKYVEAGGVLLIDNCGGGSDFTGGLLSPLQATFDCGFNTVAPNHPILQPSQYGMTKLDPPVIRKYAQDFLRQDIPPIQVIYAGKGTLLVSKLDLVSGLLGTQTWGIMGYAPGWAESFMQNAIFWTMDGQATIAARLSDSLRPADDGQ